MKIRKTTVCRWCYQDIEKVVVEFSFDPVEFWRHQQTQKVECQDLPSSIGYFAAIPMTSEEKQDEVVRAPGESSEGAWEW